MDITVAVVGDAFHTDSHEVVFVLLLDHPVRQDYEFVVVRGAAGGISEVILQDFVGFQFVNLFIEGYFNLEVDCVHVRHFVASLRSCHVR